VCRCGRAADHAGSGLASTTAAGLARRVTPAQWQAMEAGLAAVTGRMLSLLPAPRAAALTDGPVTIDLDTTDVEVYGRKKRGVAYNHQGQRVGRPHVPPGPRPRSCWPPTWALAALPPRARASGRVAMRADAGYFAGQLARAAHDEQIAFAIGAKRIARLWRLLAGIAEDDWHEAIDMDNAQVAVAQYCPDWWPENTALLIRRVLLDPGQVSAGPRSRRRRTLHPASLVPKLSRSGDHQRRSMPDLETTVLQRLLVSTAGDGACHSVWFVPLVHHQLVLRVFYSRRVWLSLETTPGGTLSYQPPSDHRADAAAAPPPGWYMDPNGLQGLRWWDGTRWSSSTQPLPERSQQPQPPYSDATGSVGGKDDVFRQKSAGRHRQQPGPHDRRAHVQGSTPVPSLASSPSGGPQPGKPLRGRQRWKIIFITVVPVVVALGITSLVVFRSGQANVGQGNVGCWMESQDGTVVAESQVGQTCTDTARLVISPQDGGTYDNLSGPVRQPGSLICTVTAPSSESWKVWAEPDTDGQEALGLCRMLNNAQMTAAGTRAAALLEGSNGQYETPPEATPYGVASSYSYQDGWDAATKATYIDLEVASSSPPGAGIFTAQEDDNVWCIDNDPNGDGTGGNNSDGSRFGDSSVWYEGCMAELESHPPEPLVITPNTPGYSEGYALGKEANRGLFVTDIFSPQGWCDTYAVFDYTYAPGNGQDTNPKDDPAVVGCLAALRARGFQ
jgi:hypothetical protein